MQIFCKLNVQTQVKSSRIPINFFWKNTEIYDFRGRQIWYRLHISLLRGLHFVWRKQYDFMGWQFFFFLKFCSFCSVQKRNWYRPALLNQGTSNKTIWSGVEALHVYRYLCCLLFYVKQNDVYFYLYLYIHIHTHVATL